MSSESDPITRFCTLWEFAKTTEEVDATQMIIATATPTGVPSARYVLLKSVDDRGFVFFTNYESRKANELNANPNISMVMHFNKMKKQIRVEGTAAKVSAAESDAYFATRSRNRQLGAWASSQSRPLPNRDDFSRQLETYEMKFPTEVPRPAHWGGFRIKPTAIEFWSDGDHRLHTRQRYEKNPDGSWNSLELYP